ncbi:MAG: hypothetical protein ACK2UK_10380 [Candidatus Promineifilaceae bacterium]|jgi:hypothetical protein
MKRYFTQFLMIAALMILMVSACGPAGSQAPAGEPAAEPTLSGLQQAPAARATPLPENYPPPEQVLPEATPTLSADYPARPTLPPTVDPYPGGLVWVLRPVGTQCEEGTEPGYGNLREAQSTLTAASIKVAQAEMTELMVTASCGSPTSAHYRVEIAAEDLDAALSLGWIEE